MSRIEARRKNESAVRLRFSQSLVSLRQRLSHASVRSTIQRLGSTTNPLVWGFETDIQASGQKGGSTFGALTATPAALTTLTTDHKLRWFGTSRSRLGFL